MEAKTSHKVLAHRIKSLFRPSSAESPQATEAADAESDVERPVQSHVDPTPPSPPPSLPSRLETLPSELGAHILASLTRLSDLKAAVHASPILYKQYRENRKSVLYNVLRQALGDKAFVDAYAVQTSAPLELPPYLPAFLAVQSHMSTHQQYSSAPSTVFDECAVEELIGMAAFYISTISPLLKRIPEKLLRNLDRSLKLEGGLRSVERLRIARALYRFQLWCNLYGTGDGAACRDQTVDHFDMLVYFFEVFPAWEIEEISCIHAFFMDMYDRIFVDIRWDLHKDSIRFVDFPRGETPVGSVDLSHGLVDDGEHRNALLNGVISRGLEYHLQIMKTTDHAELVSAMQGTIQTGHNSIEDALSIATQHIRRTMDPSDKDEPTPIRFKGDHEDTPPAAWVGMWQGHCRNYHGGMLPFGLKRWGYVFWNYKRLKRSRGRDVLRRAWPPARAGAVTPEAETLEASALGTTEGETQVGN